MSDNNSLGATATRQPAGHERSQSSLSSPSGDHQAQEGDSRSYARRAFSPGPWRVRQHDRYPCFTVVSGPSFSVKYVNFATDVGPAECRQRDRDAHLISAAPDLYEALDLFVMHGRMMAIEKALAALAKARGGS